MKAPSVESFVDSSSEFCLRKTKESLVWGRGMICLNVYSSGFVPLKMFIAVEIISPYARPYPLYSQYEKYPQVRN